MPGHSGHLPRRFPGHFVPHRLCNHFTAHGWCRKAEACTFAHGLQELHPEVQHQLAPQMGLVPVAYPGAGKGKGKVMGKTNGKGYVLENEQASFYELSMDAAAYEAAQMADGLFSFNAGAAPFVPKIPGAEANDATKELASVDGHVAEDGADKAQHPEVELDHEDLTPSRRRPHPSPLQLDDSPSASISTMRVISQSLGSIVMSPTAVTTVVRQSMMSPTRTSARIITTRQPLASPKTVMISPTKYAGATSGPLHGFTSPKTVVISSSATSAVHPLPLASPKTVLIGPGSSISATLSATIASAMAAVAASSGPAPAAPGPAVTPLPPGSPTVGPLLLTPSRGPGMVFRSPAGAPWPGSPTMGAASPQGLPGTPLPISRGLLLQARTVVQRLEQGPPGLAHCAPTPTTKAQRFGFRYPQPGWFSTVSATQPLQAAAPTK